MDGIEIWRAFKKRKFTELRLEGVKINHQLSELFLESNLTLTDIFHGESFMKYFGTLRSEASFMNKPLKTLLSRFLLNSETKHLLLLLFVHKNIHKFSAHSLMTSLKKKR